MGRYLSSDETLPGKNDVIVISEGFWKQKLGGKADVIGSTVQATSKGSQSRSSVSCRPASRNRDGMTPIFGRGTRGKAQTGRIARVMTG